VENKRIEICGRPLTKKMNLLHYITLKRKEKKRKEKKRKEERRGSHVEC